MKLLRPAAAALTALAVASTLAGCVTLGTVTNPINQSEVFQLENAYGVAQSAAVAYTALPRCAAGTHATATTICSEHAIIVTLATDDQKARLALTALESFARNPANYPGLSYVGLLKAAQLAVSTLSQIEATNGIGG
jgi:hypothetical protein